MTSCERRHTSAYSDDLRWRVIWQREGLGYTYSKIAKNLCIDANRILRLLLRSGSVSKRKYPSDRSFRKLTKPAELFILNILLMRPGIMLLEIHRELQNTLLIHISISTICNFLHKNGFTRQKLCAVALQQNQVPVYVRCLHVLL